ncbi:hypothetical protein JO972_03345 [Verrucomicrobiaceae bacterium 5K15]|uniref:Uncharacterized protein n=1 Tax=Oceaniferula flava TaxID=2800421 RepID=A0AAE2VB12_9BACT|nr:hypothetical protein [Oceaniferula flavus]MBK1853980.1 hypothetical protein [Oceaniferula flavus]MBM1135286.1 hypothetical protein [Oceaniferula flavus]
MMKKLATLFLLALLPMTSLAGSRGVELAFVDASPPHTTPEGKRLAELLVMDMKALYTGNLVGGLFPWSENTLDLKVVDPRAYGISFDRLLNTKDAKKIGPILEKNRVFDGMIVFYYDRANGYARLKLYDNDGSELLLLRLPLEGKSSAMKYSLMKGHRRGALTAIGANVRWSP